MTRTVRIPRLTITLDGTPLPVAAMDAVRSVAVAQRVNLPDQLELVVGAPVPAGVAGVAVRVDVEGHPVPMFTGTVVAAEHGFGPDGARSTHLRAYDGLHTLRSAYAVVVHERATIATLAKEWAGEAGLSTQIHADGPQLARVVQGGQSALDVLQELSARSGVMFHLRQQTLHLFGPEGAGDVLALRWGETLREARIDVNSAAGPRPVQVDAWDPLGAATVTATTEGKGESGPVRLSGAVASSDDEAAALARAHAERRASAARALWAVADGDTRLRPGAVAELSGDDALAGQYTLMAVTHRLDDHSGFSSELSSARPESPLVAPTRVTDVQLATVASVDDPVGLGRIAVTVDAFDAVTTEWLQVVVPAAGTGKGFVALPDVGDHVLVLAPGGDVGRGIVLGGLFGTAGAFDPGVVDASVRRFTWRTRGGHVVCLDDDQRRIRIEDATGSFVELGPDTVVLHAAVDLSIEAPGKAITITAAAVDFEQG